jgi:cytoskeletal protein CcmA (bactofilin family)
MFLKKMELPEILRSTAGSTLLPVLGLMVLGLLVMSLLAASLTQSLSVSSGNRANVQSQAAAESGVLAARNLILNGECTGLGILTNAGPPAFTATIWRDSGASSWVNSCPLPTTKRVRIISAGESQSGSIGTAGFGLRSIVESVFDYSAGGPLQTGPAMLSFDGEILKNYEIKPAYAKRGDLVFSSGDFECQNDTIIDGTVIVLAGGATLAGNCEVTGYVWARDSITLSGSSRVGLGVKSGTGAVTIGSSSHVFGDAEAKCLLEIDGAVEGNAVSAWSVKTGVSSRVGQDLLAGSGGTGTCGRATASVVKGLIAGDVKVNSNRLSIYLSNALIQGSVTVPQISNSLKYYTASYLYTSSGARAKLGVDGIVLGTISTTPAPQNPIVNFVYDSPPWVHFTYDYSDWQSAGFQQELVWPSGECSIPDNVGSGTSALDSFWRDLQAATINTVIDARSCSSISGKLQLSIKADVAFITSKLNLQTLSVDSGDDAEHKFWLIVPDGEDGSNLGPDCNGNAEHISVSQAATIIAPIIALAYGPCTFSLPADSLWRGQIYSGAVGTGPEAHYLAYASLGLPGVDLATGQLVSQYESSLVLLTSRNLQLDGQ